MMFSPLSKVSKRAIDSVRSMYEYIQKKISRDGAPHDVQMRQFKAARIFCPFRLLERVSEAEASAWNVVEPLLCIKGFTNEVLDVMCQQYVALVTQLRAWCDGKERPVETMQRVDAAWVFWTQLKLVGTCSAWVSAAARVALLLPSSSDVERFFSAAGGTTKRTQMALSEDNQEIRHLLVYNAERRV